MACTSVFLDAGTGSALRSVRRLEEGAGEKPSPNEGTE